MFLIISVHANKRQQVTAVRLFVTPLGRGSNSELYGLVEDPSEPLATGVHTSVLME